MRFEQQAKALIITGRSTNSNDDIKEWKLQFKGSDGYESANVYAKFSI